MHPSDRATDPVAVYTDTECTVHFWDSDIPSQTFGSFGEAVAHAKSHPDFLHVADIHVHTGESKEPTYTGVEIRPFLGMV